MPARFIYSPLYAMRHTQKVMRRTTLLILLIAVATACSSRKVPCSEGIAMVESINGEVMYRFDTVTNLVQRVISFSQKKNDYFMTFINRDTLELGENFEGMVMLSKKAKIHFKAPIDTVTNDSYFVRWKPSQVGQYEFKGNIEFENRDYDFKWKFIVVEVGQRTNRLKFREEVVEYNSPF